MGMFLDCGSIQRKTTQSQGVCRNIMSKKNWDQTWNLLAMRCLFPSVSLQLFHDLPGVLVSWLLKKRLVWSILQYGTKAFHLHSNFCLNGQRETLFWSVSVQSHQFMDTSRVYRRETWEIWGILHCSIYSEPVWSGLVCLCPSYSSPFFVFLN